MPAYVIIRIQASDPGLLKDYQQVAPGIIEKHQGKFLARGGEVICLEGSEDKRRTIIIEFPDLDKAKAFYCSDEYTKARELRKDVSEAEIIAVDGLKI